MDLIVTSASVVSLFIACLGLFGMVLLSVSRRTKEIGIRKVLGASLANMIALLSNEYLILVLVANLIAWPLAWIVMNRWLQNFAYRVEDTGWIYILSGLIAFIIAALTVSYQTIKTARTNPVESLRYE
jgi:putative ABC transport system permease protein